MRSRSCATLRAATGLHGCCGGPECGAGLPSSLVTSTREAKPLEPHDTGGKCGRFDGWHSPRSRWRSHAARRSAHASRIRNPFSCLVGSHRGRSQRDSSARTPPQSRDSRNAHVPNKSRASSPRPPRPDNGNTTLRCSSPNRSDSRPRRRASSRPSGGARRSWKSGSASVRRQRRRTTTRRRRSRAARSARRGALAGTPASAAARPVTWGPDAHATADRR